MVEVKFIEHYVCGLAFSNLENYVLLVRKLRPEWQQGLLNGIGGKINKNEDPIDAMVREFKEETGIDTTKNQWTRTVVLTVLENEEVTAIVNFYHTNISIDLLSSRHLKQNDIGETLICAEVSKQYKIIPNLKWIIPLSMGAGSLQNVKYAYPICVIENVRGG